MQDLAVQSSQVGFTTEEISILKSQIMPNASDAELALFGKVCAQTGLSPFARQIFAVSRNQWNPETQREEKKWSFQTSVDGFRLVAQRSHEYEGQTFAQWCGDDGKWVDVWLSDKYPRAARVGVFRKGFREPLYAIAMWDSYVQQYKDKKTGQFRVANMWDKMPELMLSKCAECLALRKAFPQELSGVYSKEEMEQSETEEVRHEEPKKITQIQHVETAKPEEIGTSKAVKAIIAKKNSISPDEYITAGKRTGDKISELSKSEMEAWMVNYNKLDKAKLEATTKSDMDRTYQAMQNKLEEIESGLFSKFVNNEVETDVPM